MAHILIVDDVSDVRSLSAAILNRAGHTTQTARDALEAAHFLEQERFDLALIDIFLLLINGLDLLRLWGHEYPAMRMVAVSGVGADSAGNDVLVEASHAGAAASPRKPIDAAVLLSVVERALA